MTTVALDYALTATGATTPVAGLTYQFAIDTIGQSLKNGSGDLGYMLGAPRAFGDNGVYLPDDRFRLIVQETRSKEILTRDMIATNLQIQRQLSGPCTIECDVDPNDPSVSGIYFKPWRQYVHVEKTMQGKRKIWATGIVQPSETDDKTGVLHLKAKGFAGYPKDMPWLENINWIANDAFDPVVEIWDHLQSFPNGDLGVEVFPTKCGAEMLPGYAFDGGLWNMNFFATFVRETDRLDCGDYIDALAKDTPFDYAERSEWNADRTDVIKKIELGYPRLGAVQDKLAFVINENVTAAKPHTESSIDWVSDVGISGWFPGVESSYELANADPNRLRRYLKEEDAFIDSDERAAAWAHRKLARRQTPAYWETITIIPDHPNAPFGSFDVGDTITVSGFMPWVGDVVQDHKIMAISISEKDNICQLNLKAEGQFNYDAIYYPNGQTNIIDNTGFNYDLTGWTLSDQGWQWDGTQGVTALGAAWIDADGNDHDLITEQPYAVNDFQRIPLSVYVKCVNALAASGATPQSPAIALMAQFYDDQLTPTSAVTVEALTAPSGMVAWTKLAGSIITPIGSTRVALRVRVSATLLAGRVWIDDAEIQL